MASVTNFVNFLNSIPKRPADASSTADVLSQDDLRLMQLIGTAKLLAPPDFAKFADLTPEEAAAAAEKLKKLNLVELVQQSDNAENLYLRLTPAGQSVVKSQSAST